jgi:hypothetical protein
VFHKNVCACVVEKVFLLFQNFIDSKWSSALPVIKESAVCRGGEIRCFTGDDKVYFMRISSIHEPKEEVG